jgi:hypothetical protein
MNSYAIFWIGIGSPLNHESELTSTLVNTIPGFDVKEKLKNWSKKKTDNFDLKSSIF